MFQLGDRVRYSWPAPSGPDRYVDGEITFVCSDWVGATIDPLAERCANENIAFNTQGGHSPSMSTYRAPNPEGRLKLIERKHQTMTTEYPPKPAIGYGSFDDTGRPIQPGHYGSVRVGYGILNAPQGFYGIVTPDTDGYHKADLDSYLDVALTTWTNECRAIDWQSVPNKWETLIGCSVADFNLYRDEVTLSVKTPGASWDYITVRYRQTQLVPGILTAAEISRAFGDYETTITAVEDDILTTSRGDRFAISPRFFTETQIEPDWVLSTVLQRRLMDNLDMVLANRDSERLAA